MWVTVTGVDLKNWKSSMVWINGCPDITDFYLYSFSSVQIIKFGIQLFSAQILFCLLNLNLSKKSLLILYFVFIKKQLLIEFCLNEPEYFLDRISAIISISIFNFFCTDFIRPNLNISRKSVQILFFVSL